MHYTCPDCHQDREPRTEVLSVLYRQTTVIVDSVPGTVCAACGSVSIHPDTHADLDTFLRTRRRLRSRLAYAK